MTPIKPALGLMPPHRTQQTAVDMMAEDRVRGLPMQTSHHRHTCTGLGSVCSHSHTDAVSAQAVSSLQIVFFFFFNKNSDPSFVNLRIVFFGAVRDISLTNEDNTF